MAESLRARARLDYPASIQHLFICDACDTASRSIVQAFLAAHPMLRAEIVLVETGDAAVASKIRKLQAALARADGEILCFMDDDVAPRPDALRVVLPYLYQPGAGAAFGLPCYTNWRTPWSSLMSGLVNANMLLSFVALTYLAEPFRITGHIATFRRDIFLDVGGLDGLEQHIDDDFEMARRLRAHGLRSVQTPLRHGISTTVRGPRHYVSLIQRWFVLPRESLLRHLGWYDRAIIYGLGLVPALLPLLLLVSLLLRPSRRKLEYALLYFGYSFSIFARLNARYLRNATPWKKAWWVPVIQVVFPVQLLIALLSPQRINWRGNIVQVERGGSFRYIRPRSSSVQKDS